MSKTSDKTAVSRGKATPESADSVAERILSVALEIINETGEFDLPMRLLAARAGVSLRTPYSIFGSKSGVITRLLQRDQVQWRRQLRPLQTKDPVSNLFDNLQRGMEFFRARQPFYRALYRATQVYSGGGESEAARETLRPMRTACRRMRDAGLLAEGLDDDLLAESLTDLFASTMREWANTTMDIRMSYLRCAYGAAILLAGSAVDSVRPDLIARARQFQEGFRAG